ncbi:MAG: hypothetical protein DHS20C12_11930 [Pseudohongiella sp.]|nr:MAG: hypothetical protein DHS20C12_11930 [Pseudohongiella sp.]
MELRVEHNVPEIVQWLEQASQDSITELLAGVTQAQLLYERHAKEGTPVGVGGGAGLRGSIASSQPQVLAEGVIGLVGTSLAHALPVELGTKPHFPPIAPLELWVQKKLGIESDQAKSVAWAIAKTIAKKGTKGQRMFGKAFEQTQGQMEQILTEAVRRLADRMNKS